MTPYENLYHDDSDQNDQGYWYYHGVLKCAENVQKRTDTQTEITSTSQNKISSSLPFVCINIS